MKNRLLFCLSIFLSTGVLLAPTGIAAEMSEFEAAEFFNPLPLPGFPSPQVGEILALPTIACPGHEPTGDLMQPCPVGSRTHLRNGIVVSRMESEDFRMTGMMTVVFNANVDANFEGPAWGTFSLAVDSGGTWQGTWHGLRVAEDGYWIAALDVRGKGFGGEVDGMKLMAVDEIFVVTPLPIAYIGTIEGRIIDPN